MDPDTTAGPNTPCPLHGQTGQGHIAVHSKNEKRFRTRLRVCRNCTKTFAATTDTLFYRRKYDHHFITSVISLMAYGCPPRPANTPTASMNAP